MSKVIRKLRGYEKNGDDLVVEYELPPLELSYLQNLFGLPETDPMFDAYDVEEKHRTEIEKHIDKTIDWESYAFFVE